GRDVGQELPLSEPLANEVRPGVERPDAEDKEDDPAALGADPREGRRRGQGRRLMAEPEDEPEERRVERPEDRREPRRQSVPRIGLGERADGGEDRARRDEQQPARVDRGDDRRIERQRPGEHDPEPRQRRVARRRQELEDLASGKDRGDDDDRHDPRPAEQEGDDERRDEDSGARGTLAEQTLAKRRRAVQRPNRRVRLANSRSAASKASAPKSGQRTSVV